MEKRDLFKSEDLSKVCQLGSLVERLRAYRYYNRNSIDYSKEARMIKHIDEVIAELNALGIEVVAEGLY